jgi:hypothetical protein
MTTATYTADDLDHSEDDTLTCYECGFGIAPVEVVKRITPPDSDRGHPA